MNLKMTTAMKTCAVLAMFAISGLAAGAWAGETLEPSGRWTAKSAGAAKTPPMGWNSWNAFRTEVDEAKVMGAAQALVDSGLNRLGYVYVNLDDGWWLKRRQTDGRMQIRTNIFPSARTQGPEQTSFRPFTDRLHAMGLKAGIYTDVGRNACSQAFDLHSPNLPEGTALEREIGLDGHVDQDIKLYFAEWGFDYVKVDACGLADFAPDRDLVKDNGYRGFAPIIDRSSINRTDVADVRRRYQAVADALKAANPDGDYVLSLCNWGTADVRTWGQEVGNLWRTSNDITPTWVSMLHNFDSAARRALYAKPGAWNDPDILYIGKGEFDVNHLTEARAHFSMWAIINAPLFISYDLRKAPKPLMDIWGNADVVRINQDPAGHQGVVTYDSDDVQIIVKTLSDSTRKAVALVNRGSSPQKVSLMAGHMKYDGGQPVALRDLWSKQTLAPFTGTQSIELAPYETRLFEAQGTRELKDGVYLSEVPAFIHVAEDGVDVPQPDPLVHRNVDPWAGTQGGSARPQYAGWGGAQADVTPYGQLLQVAGKVYASGIGVLGDSRLEVRNDGFTSFDVKVGVDDSTLNTAKPVRFAIYGDGRKLAETAPVRLGDAAVPLSVPVSGVKVIELIARSDTDAAEYPVVVTWAEAALRR